MTAHALSNLTSTLPLADMRWFRPGVSTTAHYVDNLFYLISVVCVVFFVLVIALMAWFMWKYRARPGHREEHSPHHNNTLEIAWSVIPLLLVIVIFYYGFTGYIDMRNVPDDAYEIEVVAQKWSWQFKYPNGAISNVLHVPADTNVHLKMSSKDVLHSLYIPAFRVKMDCVPGRYTEVWFKVEEKWVSKDFRDDTFDNDNINTKNKYSDGSAAFNEAEPMMGYDLFCTEYCGDGHSSMVTKCVVHSQACFELKLEELADVRKQGTPIEVGEALYNQRGCAQCHSIKENDDRPGTGGPSFKGYYGKQVQFVDGSSAAMDDNYIRESILNPQAKVRKGFRPIMPTFQGSLNDDEIYALRQYIRSLNEQQAEDWEPIEGAEAEGDMAPVVESPSSEATPDECGFTPAKKDPSAGEPAETPSAAGNAENNAEKEDE